MTRETCQVISRTKGRAHGCPTHKWNGESKTEKLNPRTKWITLVSNQLNDFAVSKKTQKNQKRRQQLQ